MPIDEDRWGRFTKVPAHHVVLQEFLEERYPKAYNLLEIYEGMRDVDIETEDLSVGEQQTLSLYYSQLELLVDKGIIEKGIASDNAEEVRTMEEMGGELPPPYYRWVVD